MSGLSLDGRVVVLTGAGGGMGRAIARSLGEAGADLVLIDSVASSLPPVAESAREAGRRALELAIDTTARDQVESAIADAVSQLGRIDVLVNSAGVVGFYPLEDYPEDDFDKVLGVNLKGTFLMTQAAGRVMLDAGSGAVINLSSIAAVTPSPSSAAYSLSKAAVNMLTRQTAEEWGPRGVRANGVAPGGTNWPMAGTEMGREVIDAMSAVIPMGRAAWPEDVASVVRFLASDESAYVNGQVIGVDGGFTSSLLSMLYREIGYRAETPAHESAG